MERLESDNYSDFSRKKEKIGGDKESVYNVDERKIAVGKLKFMGYGKTFIGQF